MFTLCWWETIEYTEKQKHWERTELRDTSLVGRENPIIFAMFALLFQFKANKSSQ